MIWRADYPFVLASGSAARRALLAAAGLRFEAVAADIDERAIEAKLADAGDLALELATAKALAVSAARPRALVIGADQTLTCEGVIFHKSRDRNEALRTLAALAGRTHRLTSAFALARNGEKLAAETASADMTMRALDSYALTAYLDAAGPDVLSSVGVYHWEGLGAQLFERVEGDHSTILGLPMLKLLAALRGLKTLAF